VFGVYIFSLKKLPPLGEYLTLSDALEAVGFLLGNSNAQSGRYIIRQSQGSSYLAEQSSNGIILKKYDEQEE